MELYLFNHAVYTKRKNNLFQMLCMYITNIKVSVIHIILLHSTYTVRIFSIINVLFTQWQPLDIIVIVSWFQFGKMELCAVLAV